MLVVVSINFLNKKDEWLRFNSQPDIYRLGIVSDFNLRQNIFFIGLIILKNVSHHHD